MDKARKKELLRQWKDSQKRKFVLSKTRAKKLLTFVDKHVAAEGCDHTLRFTRRWLEENLPEEKRAAAMEEIDSMGGCCDCEVVLNCYEDYELM